MLAEAELDSSLISSARRLADQHRNLRPRPRPIAAWQGINATSEWLQAARLACVDPPPGAGKAAEWLLDNDYQIHRALRQIKTDLPPSFYFRLPALADHVEVCPRVYMVAHELLRATKMQISLTSAVRFVGAYQLRTPLTIAELWAFPTMLRIACVEMVVAALTPMLEGRLQLPFEPSPCASDPHSLDATERVARAVANLGVIAAIPWEDFFDRTSLVEMALSKDPSRFYAKMDFETRDRYRRAVEEIAHDSGASEDDVASRVVKKAGAAASGASTRHVGYWLIDVGRYAIEGEVGARPPRSRRLQQLILARPGLFYALAMTLAGLAALLLPALYLVTVGAGLWGSIAALLLTQIPASVVATAAVNWTITHLLPPRVLPKLDCSKGLSRDAKTLIAVPVVVGRTKEVAGLIEQLETHWLANNDPLLQIALLADLADAPEQHTAADAEVERALDLGVRDLNRRHGRRGRGPFHLLLRPRLYNAAQGCWMAWERKRGKLEQFNRLLIEGEDAPFSHHVGSKRGLKGVRFVVTVDADTMLPSGSVARLAGTLAHPLNRAKVDPASGRIVAGYSVIQPRTEISPQSGSRTLFARLFTGDTAIDIYSRAVSDVYQDLFGAGIFVGKGIYDLQAFHASVDGRVPENRILSHDLFEGAHGRAALATDIVLYEGFPASYLEFAQRMHRWIRGDWQLLPWLGRTVPDSHGKSLPNRMPGIDRWKLLDNLRRSLVAPASVLLALAGWMVLPGSPWFWTALVIFAPGAQLFTDLVSGLARGRRRGAAYGFLSRLSDQAGRWLLALTYMLYEALLSLHAVTVTLWRSFISHRAMLEWTAAAHVAARMGDQRSRRGVWAQMWPASLLALVITLGVALLRPSSLIEALPLLVLWVSAPEFTLWISRPRQKDVEPLTDSDRHFLRLLARKTWLYFETFAGPEDNWLPPDNYQGDPYEEIAHRTSPTNIGMLLLSTATAWDLGYIGRAELVARTRNVFESLARLERYRGHFYNWYDTRHLTALEPRYVSTVDSGNLAVSLIASAETLREAAFSPEFEASRWQGLRDDIDLMLEVGVKLGHAGRSLARAGAVVRAALDGVEKRPADWRRELELLCDDAIPGLEAEAARLVEQLGSDAVDAVDDLVAWIERLHYQALAMRHDLAAPPTLAHELAALADEAHALAWSMDFAPLYDLERRLFHIGYNVSASRIDTHHYDLLASEARLASFFAIAKRDVPIEHWFHLERPVRKVPGGLTLVSWSGSMFEYLMPRLLLRSRPETLLGESERAAVEVQRRQGEAEGLPWGVSESAYAARDPEQRFRYQAFGVPTLGLRRGLARDAVVTPYASALALAILPVSAAANLRHISRLGAGGRYGLFEALDFTPERRPGSGEFAPVNAFMAHHQGMLLCAINNALHDDRLVERFARDPQVRLVSLLLSERVPHEIPPEIERLDELDKSRATSAPLRAPPAWVPAAAPFPQVHLLGNGRLSSWISEAGGGGLRWHGQLITRFRPDAVRDADGMWLYIHDEELGEAWSATRQPTGVAADESRTVFHPHMAEFHRRDHGIDLRLEVALSATDDLEVRRFSLANESNRDRSLRVTSYAEIVLAPPLEDERHPAFSKLFVESRRVPQFDGLLFTRRPRGPEETPAVVLQFVIGSNGRVEEGLEYETDRRAFIGRGRSLLNPVGAATPLDGMTGFTLDAVSALQVQVKLQPGERHEYCIVTIAAATPDAAFEIAERHVTLSSVDWLLADAAPEAARTISRCRVEPSLLRDIQCLGSLLVHPHGALRPRSTSIRANRLDQSGLWGMTLSGDLPILLLRVKSSENALLRELVCAHQWWRRHGLEVDLVFLQNGGSAYVEPMREEIRDLLRELGTAELLGRNGGVHLLFADQVGADQVRLLEATAWAILDETAGSLSQQIRKARKVGSELPPFIASIPEDYHSLAALERPGGLLFDNGFGGFSPDGREYVIHLEPGEATPAPWVNLLANDDFGTLISESGGGYSWAINSGENRLTPWTNDPVVDRPVETLYLRDEETASVWTVTPAPAGTNSACQVRHGAGYSEWRQNSRGLEQRMRVLVPTKASVKLVKLTLRNPGPRHRRITATYYAEWMLGALPSMARHHVHCDFDETAQAILATNRWSADFAERVAFLTASLPSHGFTTDREEFLGREGVQARPAGLLRWGLSGTLVAGKDACGALQVHLDLPPGSSAEVVFALGQGANRVEAAALAAHWRVPREFDEADAAVARRWDDLLGAVEVHTPDPAFDLMINRWLPYQSLSARVLGRTGFYQSSGAYGFRDQLQDVLALLIADPARVRAHILRCAQHQFEEGDVLHWWHPPSSRGVRTRCSDDLLWLPYAVSTYVEATGDVSILEEDVAFLQAPSLGKQEADRYARFETGSRAPLIEHCDRALKHMKCGSHGLPLMGSSDWNDGMNRVGDKGRGESVWLAWFAAVTAAGVADLHTRLGRASDASHWRTYATDLRKAAEREGWDGSWFRRAYDDDGIPLGEAGAEECRIDSISQSWAAFAGANSERVGAALSAAGNELIDKEGALVRLLWPPFDRTFRDPGYIKAYPPGLRENGGQYCHAAAWLGLAYAQMGQGEHARRIFDMLNPLARSGTREGAERYRIEPYAMAGDICTVGALRGRGGWSWYTGAAAWTWRLGVEGLLGVTLRDGRLHIDPRLPEGWSEAKLTVRRGKATIALQITDADGGGRSPKFEISVDGVPCTDREIAFPARGGNRSVVVRLVASR